MSQLLKISAAILAGSGFGGVLAGCSVWERSKRCKRSRLAAIRTDCQFALQAAFCCEILANGGTTLSAQVTALPGAKLQYP